MSVDPNKYDVGELRQLADEEAGESGEAGGAGESGEAGGAAVWTDRGTAPEDPAARAGRAGEGPATWGDAAGTAPASDPGSVFASDLLSSHEGASTSGVFADPEVLLGADAVAVSDADPSDADLSDVDLSDGNPPEAGPLDAGPADAGESAGEEGGPTDWIDVPGDDDGDRG